MQAPEHWPRLSGVTIVCSGADALLQRVPVPVLFIFEDHLDPEPLLLALHATLASFPIFSGRLRLTKEALYIDCNDAGISSSTVHLDEDFISVLERIGRGEGDDLTELVDPAKCLAGAAPLLTVRFNQARDRGTILGMCWHHSVGDMSTLMALMRAWSNTSQGRAFVPPIIDEDRSRALIEAVRGRGTSTPGIRRLGFFELVRFVGYLMFQAKKQEIGRFYFSPAELEAMRADLGEKAGKKLSRNDALCAHLASIIFPLDPRERPHALAMAIDWRARLDLSPERLGNFVGGILVDVNGTPDPAEIASRIRGCIENCIEDHLDYEPTVRMLRDGGGPTAARRHVALGIDPLRGTLLITNWARFRVHDLEFQGKRCSVFSSGARPPFPWLSAITEGPHGHGLAYSVSLPPAMGKALKRPETVACLHQYRPAGDALPGEVTRDKTWL